MESEETEGRTLVQVISEKYSPENFPYCRGPGVGVVIRSSPQGSPVKDRLNLPRILVLDSCGITEAGDEEEVATFCAHVVELDLSHNQLKDWGEISKILSNIPNLDFLNLSMNPLRGSSLEPGAAEAFSGLRRLVLNNTHVTWDMVHTLTREILELEELFLCLNEYESVSVSSIPCPSLRLLHITDNQLQDWAEVRKLGLIYPGLVSLILANNSLSSIHEPEDSLLRLFPNLRSINLHNSGLCCWEDIEKLNFFPKLQEVRVMGIPLLQPYTDQERRYLMVAQLPHVTVLNGSVVTNGEREDAERFFIRYHLDCPEDELPQSLASPVIQVPHFGSTLWPPSPTCRGGFAPSLSCPGRGAFWGPDRAPRAQIGSDSGRPKEALESHGPATPKKDTCVLYRPAAWLRTRASGNEIWSTSTSFLQYTRWR
ncbi:tubulin-specific chaperone cofactor E-like protein isoform X3 [Sinocyclocheilus anshuiensis]|uniref:tubulin-specific chaperone cofactor E-like protein isoform X3 n=1 Tax=Sinocyclocheilus anshuiensis TaxID=1608454 RepID=UPI0007BA4048|nr:PREDICTED: tubulin-specific chaperone cofactor E-like protein isoform X3 [Sinocyclocheilus anshuiensis]